MSAEVVRVIPEIVLFITTCVVMVLGLSKDTQTRKATVWVCAIGLIAATALSGAGAGAAAEAGAFGSLFPELMPYSKALIGIVALMLLPLLTGTVDREDEDDIAAGRAVFNPLKSNRAEFYAFFLFSITGLMLVASADDLIWLFLALELTSLPTYVMVSISSRRTRAQEAGVKYFFLGALGAAVFLYGFALLYGATGSTNLAEIASVLHAQRDAGASLSPLALAGLAVALLGVSFKIAAAPMHFYAADVYQGAASGVSAMLAFVPKAAGFIAILLLCGTVGWGPSGATGGDLPEPIFWLLTLMAGATMIVGNVLALLQTSIKRILAYSSIAHSGYMLVGVIAGPPRGLALQEIDGPVQGFWNNGVAAMLFYLLCYGVMNVGAFAVLASLETRDKDGHASGEIDEIDDLRGLHKRKPHLALAMLLCSLSLLGLPPLLGFWGKLGLFTSGVHAGLMPLVVLMAFNSAIGAFYYLRMAVAAYLDPIDEERTLEATPFMSRPMAAMISAGGVVVLLAAAGPLIDGSVKASSFSPPIPADEIRGEATPAPVSAPVSAPPAEAEVSMGVSAGGDQAALLAD